MTFDINKLTEMWIHSSVYIDVYFDCKTKESFVNL